MITSGYKVCSVFEQGPGRPMIFYSATTLGKVVKYRQGVRTERPEGCGPLMVFKDLAPAVDFARNVFSGIVFTCIYEVSQNTRIPEDLIRMSTSLDKDIPILILHGVWAGLTWDCTSILESVVDFADSVSIGVPVWSSRSWPNLLMESEESLQIPLFP